MYSKTTWIARVGTALNRFLKANESSGSVELTADPTGVSTPGTPFTVANMNKIEQGIYDAHEILDANTLDATTPKIDQDVKTTASPTFAKLTLTTSTEGSQTIAPRATYLVPIGLYTFTGVPEVITRVFVAGAWVGAGPLSTISDGTNVQLYNYSSDKTYTVYYRKFS